MFKSVIKFAAAASVTTLVACGGGGGGGEATSNADPQGIWNGPASTGYTVSAVVLDNNEIWGVYAAGGTIYGALFGVTSVSGNNISVTGTDFNFIDNAASTGTLRGSVAEKSTLSLASASVSTNLTYNSSYDTPATAAAVAGTWSFIGRSGAYSLVPGSITINGSGNFTLTQSNCSTSGSIVPRPGGKNIYNINLTSAGAGCAVGTSTLSGVTYIDTTVTPNRFLALALNANKTDGLIVIGTKN